MTAQMDRALTRAEAQGLTVARLSEWQTPATTYPTGRYKEALIRRRPYKKGEVFQAYGTRDETGTPIDFFRAEAPLPITELVIGRETWMVDDPPHWWMINRIAPKLRGRVLMGGLGLGLMAHALASNPDVDEVVIVERNSDVITLVTPYLPGVETIVCGDLHPYIESGDRFDSAFVDLWVTHSETETRETYRREVLPLAARIRVANGPIPVYALGFTGEEPIFR